MALKYKHLRCWRKKLPWKHWDEGVNIQWSQKASAGAISQRVMHSILRSWHYFKWNRNHLKILHVKRKKISFLLFKVISFRATWRIMTGKGDMIIVVVWKKSGNSSEERRQILQRVEWTSERRINFRTIWKTSGIQWVWGQGKTGKSRVLTSPGPTHSPR